MPRPRKRPAISQVEEGKHASCPDRNADGIYTPGYDVNKRINDAWGVRDVLGSGFLINSRYESPMTKPRRPMSRVLPPEHPLSCTVEAYSSLAQNPDALLGRYELRSANQVSLCEGIPERKRLAGMMKEHRFGSDYQPDQYRFEAIQKLTEPLSYAGLLPAISARYDRAPGVSVLLKGLDYGEGYIVPKINWIYPEDVSFELLFTTTAAQFFSWYLTAGAAREEDKQGEFAWNFVGEGGVKYRVQVPGALRILTLGYQFGGLRLGVRGSGFDDLDDLRFIVELGAGVF